MKEQQDKKFRVVIYDGDEIEYDQELKSIWLLGDDQSGKGFMEIIMNDNIMGMAAKLMQSTKGKHAARLGRIMDNMLKEEKSEEMSALEDLLAGMFEGGIEQ